MLFEERTPIDAPPEAVFRFFTSIEEHYRAWHPDHVTFRWVAGDRLETGAVAYFEERLGGELQRMTVRYLEVSPPHTIVFAPVGGLPRLLLPRMSFEVSGRQGSSELVARIQVRIGPLGAWLNRRRFAAVRRHMEEEGVNLKRLVEEERAAAVPVSARR